MPFEVDLIIEDLHSLMLELAGVKIFRAEEFVDVADSCRLSENEVEAIVRQRMIESIATIMLADADIRSTITRQELPRSRGLGYQYECELVMISRPMLQRFSSVLGRIDREAQRAGHSHPFNLPG